MARLAAFALGLLCACSAREASPPSVADVQARFTAAIGGVGAITRPRSMTIRGENVLYGRNGRRVIVRSVIYAANFKRLEIDTVEGRGRYVSGYDGKAAWSIAPGSRPQFASAAVLPTIRRDADLYYWAHIPKYFHSMSVVGVERFAGRACYHLRGTTLWGNENNQYYDVGNGLLVGYRFHQWMGDRSDKAETRQVFSDYRAFAGLSLPTREADFRDGRPVGVGKTVSVQFDDVPDRVFVRPAAGAGSLPGS